MSRGARALAVAAAVVSACSSCAPANTTARTNWLTGNPEEPRRKIVAPSPCSDSLYLALRARPLDSLTEREYAYFVARDRLCAQYQSGAGAEGSDDSGDMPSAGSVGVTILAVLGSLVVLAVVAN